jgi:hypothetical protein
MNIGIHTALGVAAAALLAGCGVDHLGVQSIEFPMGPVVAEGAVLDVSGATGSVQVSVVADEGTVSVAGLPAPPNDEKYYVNLMFAAHELQDLMGPPPAEETGHAHGALSHEDTSGVPDGYPKSADGHDDAPEDDGHDDGAEDDGHDDADEDRSVMIRLAAPAGGTWSLRFDTHDLQGKTTLGALRSAQVFLAPAADETGVMVLQGMLGMEMGTDAPTAGPPAEEEEDGHSHGP